MQTYEDVYAVPGVNNIVDVINPATGLTMAFGHTEAQVTARYPDAVRMTWAEWSAAASARQQAPILWEAVAVDQFNDMLNVLPPAMMIGCAFMVGEPCDHDFATGRPRFQAYWKRAGQHFAASRPMTREEFRAEIR